MEKTRNAAEHIIANGGRTEDCEFRLEYLGHDIVLVRLGDIVGLHHNARIRFDDPFCDSISQLSGPIPHGIVRYSDLILLICVAPLSVLFYNLQRVLTPDYSMTWSDDVDIEVQRSDFGQLPLKNRAKWCQDVCVVFHGLIGEYTLISHIVEHTRTGIMLSKRIIAKQNVIAGKVAGHAIRPVQHGHLYEDQLFPVAYIECVSSLYSVKVLLFVILSFQ